VAQKKKEPAKSLEDSMNNLLPELVGEISEQYMRRFLLAQLGYLSSIAVKKLTWEMFPGSSVMSSELKNLTLSSVDVMLQMKDGKVRYVQWERKFTGISAGNNGDDTIQGHPERFHAELEAQRMIDDSVQGQGAKAWRKLGEAVGRLQWSWVARCWKID
jgi:hypothetical protein